MNPIISRQWSFPTARKISGPNGTATAASVQTIISTIADHIEKVGTVLTEYHLVDILANRPAAGKLGRHFYATDTSTMYEDIGTRWVVIGGPGFAFYTLLTATASVTLAAATNYFVKATASVADVNVNLPATTGSGVIITTKKMDATTFNINLVPAGADTIDTIPGSAIMTRQYEALNLIDFGVGSWLIW